MSLRPRLLAAVSAAAIAATAGPALAQSGDTNQQLAQNLSIDEIVVTAQRREEGIQDVPISVSAFNQVQLEQLYTRDIRDLTGRVPNLVINPVSIGPGLSQISLRGVNSQDPDKSIDPGVGVFVDGVYLGTNAYNLLESFDLERMEVLRGPQGTLFGRNTTGGAINAVRIRPDLEDFGGKGSITVGSDSRLDLKAAVNAPIIEDQLAVRIAGFRYDDDGTFDNDVGGSTGAKDSWSVVGKVLWQPSENFDALLTYDRVEDNSELIPYFPAGIDGTVALPIAVDPGFLTSAGHGPDAACLALSLCNLGEEAPGDSLNNGPQEYEAELDAITLEMNYTLGDYTFTSITGYRDAPEDVYVDFDGGPLTLFHVRRTQEYEQFTQEVRVASNLSGPFNFVAGGFYYTGEYSLVQRVNIDGVLVGAVPAPGILYLTGATERDDHESTTFALFAQGDYDITENLTLTVGARATWDEKTFSTSFFDAFPSFGVPGDLSQVPFGAPVAGGSGSATEDWFEFTPKVGLEYRFTDDILTYASYTRGYNAGGFATRAGNIVDALTPFEPETIDAYEVGLKADFEIEGKPVRTNVSVFVNQYSDKQEEQIQPAGPPLFTSTTTQNAASALVAGLEFEGTVLLTENFTLDATFGFLNAEYEDFDSFLGPGQQVPPLAAPGQPPVLAPADFSTLSLRRAPDFTWSVTPTYTLGIGPGIFTATSTVRYVDENFSEFYNDPRGLNPSNTYIDVTGSYSFGGENMDRYLIRGFVRNLTDVTDTSTFVNSIVDFKTYQTGRQFGVTLEAQF